MFYIAVASILAVLTLIGLGTRVSFRDADEPLFKYGFIIPLAILTVFTLFNSMAFVGSREIAVQTSFGRYDKTLSNGLTWKAPWSQTDSFSTLLQTGDLEGEEGTNVTFKGGGSGRVHATFRWAIDKNTSDEGARQLWQKYRDFETVQNTLVLREARDAILNVTNDYTPNDARTKQDVIGSEVAKRLQTRLEGYGVIIDSVSIQAMDLDARTQQSLDKIVASNNDVERAKADNKRAKIDVETAKLRKKTGSFEDGALKRYCLEVVNNWDKEKNGDLPATFDCGLGGTKSPVIVGSKK